jgi:hypothetical protein
MFLRKGQKLINDPYFTFSFSSHSNHSAYKENIILFWRKSYISCTCLDMFFIVIILILLYISKQYELLKVYHMVIHSKVLSNLYHFFNKMDGRGNTRFHVLVCYKLDGNNVPANNGNTDSTSFPHHAYFVTRLPSGCRPSWLSTSTLRARWSPGSTADAASETPPLRHAVVAALRRMYCYGLLFIKYIF